MTKHWRDYIFNLDDHITLLPVVHGSGDFALVVRKILLEDDFDTIAVPLPESFKYEVMQSIDELPLVQVVVAKETEGDFNYVPIDPCQPVIMALRIAQQEYLTTEFIDAETNIFEPDPFIAPDPYALKEIPIEKYASAILTVVSPPNEHSQLFNRIAYMSQELRRLRGEKKKTLMVCSISHWPWLRLAYYQSPFVKSMEPFYSTIVKEVVKEQSLVFVLGELPYLTYLYERARRELLPDENLSIDGVKELVVQSRDHWLEKEKPIHNWATPLRLQNILQYVRNLTLIHSRLTPDLYTLALAAKQICGDLFAIALIETAKLYPYQHHGRDGATFNPNQISLTSGDSGVAKNRLQGIPLRWRNLPLKKLPDPYQQQKYRQLWNPYGICSWPPEDNRIESFNTHVRETAQALIGEGLVHTEKFTSSIKDGLDIRETIRNWYTGDLYVKEIPPSRGRVESVIFIFDYPADPNKYTLQTTWYAEHENESTLSFYSTPIGDKFVGPGIAQCLYGGCLFLFPPRYIPDIWMQKKFLKLETLEERLIAGAMHYSQEKHVALVSPCPPRNHWKLIAKKYKKKIIYIPLARFSQQLVDRLRYFHVLNGKHIRSYAAQFIREV